MNAHTDFFSRVQVVDPLALPDRQLPVFWQAEVAPERMPSHLAPLIRGALQAEPDMKSQESFALGRAPLFDSTIVVRAEPFDWVVVPLEEDPLWASQEAFPIPRRVRRQLKKLKRSGEKFDRLYVAHEIPVGSLQSGEPLPLELVQPPPPPLAARAAEMLGKLGKAAWLSGQLPMVTVTSAVQSAASAAVETAVDPVLFGVKQERLFLPASPAWPEWYVLCRWSW